MAYASGIADPADRLSEARYFTIADDLPANSSTQVGKIPRKRMPSAGTRSAMRRPGDRGSAFGGIGSFAGLVHIHHYQDAQVVVGRHGGVQQAEDVQPI